MSLKEIGMTTLNVVRTGLVALTDYKKIQLTSERSDLTEAEKAERIFAMRITAVAHFLDNSVGMGERQIKKRYGEEKWENAKTLATLGVGIAEFNEAMRCSSPEQKEAMFLRCTQNLLRYTCECIERKRTRYKDDPESSQAYELLTKLKQDFTLFDTALTMTQRTKDKELTASTVDYLADICRYLETSSQLNKELLESCPILDEKRHQFEGRKQKLAVISLALLQVKDSIEEIKRGENLWEMIADQGLDILDILAGCTHRLLDMEMHNPTAQVEKREWFASLRCYAEYSGKAIGCVRDAILLKSLWHAPAPNVLAPTEAHISDAQRRIDAIQVDVDALYPHEIPYKFCSDPTLRLFCCPITNRPIRHIVAVVHTDVFFERDAILEKIRSESQPQSWPFFVPFRLDSLGDNLPVQKIIKERLATLFKEEIKSEYLRLSGEV